MADKETLEIDVVAKDNASAVLQNVRTSISSFSSGLDQFNSAIRQWNGIMSGYNSTVKRVFSEMGSAVYDFTSDAISNFTEFSEQHAETLGAMAADYDKTAESQRKFLEDSEKLKQQAMNLGTYGINGEGSLRTVTEISELQTQEIKAGISSDSIINSDVTSQILKFAEANQLDSNTAVDFATKLSNQFNVEMGSGEFATMLDKVSHAADTSVIDVSDIIQSMKYAAGISSGLDRSIDETLGMVSVLGNFGLTGSQAGSGIQAFLTRLLTGDTTVITEAMKEVAPENALKAFYDFSKYAKSDGSGLTYDQIKNAGSYDELGSLSGNLRPMDEIVEQLDETMGSLNDEEQAWFAKKLFGLYQMKSAYALINGDGADLQTVIEEIANNSEGTNDDKLSLLQNSQWGKYTSFKNLIDGLKTQFGSDISSFTSSIMDEMNSYLQNNGNYDINWDNIQSGLDESCALIEEHFGSAIADAVHKLGDLSIDLGQVAEEFAPEMGKGIIEMFNDVLDGNFLGEDGLTGDWNTMIDNLHESAGNLSPELQDLADKTATVIDFFGKLTAFNIATQIAQLVSSVMQIAMMTINAASVIVNGTGVSGTGGVGTGGSGTGSSGTGSSASSHGAMYNIGGTAAGIAGGYAGGKIAKEITDEALKDSDLSDSTKDMIGTGTTIGGSILGSIGLPKLYASIMAKIAGGSGLNGLALGEELTALNINTALGLTGDAAITGTAVGALGGALAVLPAGIYSMYDMYKENHEKSNNRSQTSDIVNGGGHVAFDNSGDIIKDSDGNVVDIEKSLDEYMAEREASLDEYAFNNGDNSTISTPAPKKTLTNWWKYDDLYSKWEDEDAKSKQDLQDRKERFYKTQMAIEYSSGTRLTWDQYTTNRASYDSQADEYLSSSSAEILNTISQQLNTIINGGDGAGTYSGKYNVADYVDKIPGINAMSEATQNQKIAQYIQENDITVTPQFTMEAPQLSVDVKLDSSGNVTSKDVKLLNPEFSNSINKWYNKSASKNGQTTK